MVSPITPPSSSANSPSTSAIVAPASDRQSALELKTEEQHTPPTDPGCAVDMLGLQEMLVAMRIGESASTSVTGARKQTDEIITTNLDQPYA